MELRELVSFYHVARLSSVSKAARTLEVGQPTVTTHLRKLEAEFGITLFDRIKRPIQLTLEGATLLELVTPVVEAVDTLKTQMNYAEHRGSFVVAGYPDLVTHYLPKSIQSFTARYPQVRIRLLARSYTPLIQMVKSGEIDLALCSPPPDEDTTLSFQELFHYNMVLLTPPDHPLLKKPGVELRDIAEWPMILPGPGSLTTQNVEQALRSARIPFEVSLAMDDSQSIIRYVSIGMGVAILSDFNLHSDDQQGIGVIRLSHLFPGSTIGICTLKGKFLGQAIQNFINTMMEDLQGFASGRWEWPIPEDGSTELPPVAVAR
jgi:DNA-binding transcriptional LysR family regulator